MNLNAHQFKIDCYRYHINFRVTSNQKATEDTQRIKRMESKQNNEESQQTTREDIKRRKEQTRTRKTNKKQLTEWQ